MDENLFHASYDVDYEPSTFGDHRSASPVQPSFPERSPSPAIDEVNEPEENSSKSRESPVNLSRPSPASTEEEKKAEEESHSHSGNQSAFARGTNTYIGWVSAKGHTTPFPHNKRKGSSSSSSDDDEQRMARPAYAATQVTKTVLFGRVCLIIAGVFFVWVCYNITMYVINLH